MCMRGSYHARKFREVSQVSVLGYLAPKLRVPMYDIVRSTAVPACFTKNEGMWCGLLRARVFYGVCYIYIPVSIAYCRTVVVQQ